METEILLIIILLLLNLTLLLIDQIFLIIKDETDYTV